MEFVSAVILLDKSFLILFSSSASSFSSPVLLFLFLTLTSALPSGSVASWKRMVWQRKPAVEVGKHHQRYLWGRLRSKIKGSCISRSTVSQKAVLFVHGEVSFRVKEVCLRLSVDTVRTRLGSIGFVDLKYSPHVGGPLFKCPTVELFMLNYACGDRVSATFLSTIGTSAGRRIFGGMD